MLAAYLKLAQIIEAKKEKFLEKINYQLELPIFWRDISDVPYDSYYELNS